MLSGVALADETFFLESRKGRRRLDRAPRKRGGKACQRGLSAEQAPILIARNRSGAATDAVLPEATARRVADVLAAVIAPDAILRTDGNPIHAAFASAMSLTHQPVNLSAGIRVREKACPVQNVNAYDSRLKGWMHRFHSVATKYLNHCLGWRHKLEKHPHPTPMTLFRDTAGMGFADQQLMQT